MQVVDLVGDKPRQPLPIDGDVPVAVDIGVFDVQLQRPGDEATDVKEAQAALVLLVGLPGGFDDAGVEQRERVAARGTHDRRGAVDADLRRGDAHALAEGVQGGYPFEGGGQLGDDPTRVLGLVGQGERAGRLP